MTVRATLFFPEDIGALGDEFGGDFTALAQSMAATEGAAAFNTVAVAAGVRFALGLVVGRTAAGFFVAATLVAVLVAFNLIFLICFIGIMLLFQLFGV